MEMELLYSRAMDMNGASVDEDDGMEPTIYKQKYERVMKELEYTKKRLQQQHEDDLEQLMALKKQLEKKVKLKSPYLSKFVQCIVSNNFKDTTHVNLQNL